ncbi:MAG TPA: 6,7-dimethyl-8-ribityllumazine synthase [Thermoanaerobaculia bacterium]|jgi:6,7-dimethyl-8-ribityllumazine synthase
MSEIERIEATLDGRGLRFAIVAARFNSRIVDRLIDGAVDCLVRHGVAPADVRVVRVPGAWELPLALAALADAGEETGSRLDGLVALAAVIRGETPHFDHLCGACVRGIARVSERHGVPVGFGVLTCDTSAQAEERAGGKAGNKGWEAASAALEMAGVLAGLQRSGGR